MRVLLNRYLLLYDDSRVSVFTLQIKSIEEWDQLLYTIFMTQNNGLFPFVTLFFQCFITDSKL